MFNRMLALMTLFGLTPLFLSCSDMIREPVLPSQNPWSTKAALPETNSEMAVAELDGKIYVMGGYPSDRITVATVQVYDAKTDRWQLTTPLPQPSNHPMAAAVNGKLYFIGGQANAQGDPERAGFLDTVFEYDPAKATWTHRAPMPTARGAGAAAVVDGKIYVAGGRPPRGHDFAVYDPGADKWTTLPNLPTQRNHLVAEAIDGKIYVVGGREGAGNTSKMTNVVEVFDPKTNIWTKPKPMPTVRGGINGIVANGCLHIFGGEGNDLDPKGMFNQHEVYNPVTDTWQSLDAMPTAVHGVTGAAFINGWIHLPGGGTARGGTSGSTIHQVFRATMQCR